MRGWFPWTWRKQFVQVEHAMEYIVEFDQELTPQSLFGTGVPPLAQMNVVNAAVPIDVTVVPTGIGMLHGQFWLTPLDADALLGP